MCEAPPSRFVAGDPCAVDTSPVRTAAEMPGPVCAVVVGRCAWAGGDDHTAVTAAQSNGRTAQDALARIPLIVIMLRPPDLVLCILTVTGTRDNAAARRNE